MAGKHRRQSDNPESEWAEFGNAGTPEEVRHFDTNVGRHVVRAADKRLYGLAPYDNETGSKPALDPNTGNRREQ